MAACERINHFRSGSVKQGLVLGRAEPSIASRANAALRIIANLGSNRSFAAPEGVPELESFWLRRNPPYLKWPERLDL